MTTLVLLLAGVAIGLLVSRSAASRPCQRCAIANEELRVRSEMEAITRGVEMRLARAASLSSHAANAARPKAAVPEEAGRQL